MIGVTCVLTIRIVGASEYANDTTYAVASRWGGLEGASPPRPVPFWRLSATNVVDSRQKESVLGRQSRPQTPTAKVAHVGGDSRLRSALVRVRQDPNTGG